MRHYRPIMILSMSLTIPGVLAAQETASGGLPEVVGQLGLTDVEVHPKKREHHGSLIRGVLPDGTGVEIDLDREGNVEEVEAESSTGFAASAVEALVPTGVRDNPSYPADASFWKLEFEDDGRIEIEGYGQDGREFEAEFANGGRLIELKIDD